MAEHSRAVACLQAIALPWRRACRRILSNIWGPLLQVILIMPAVG